MKITRITTTPLAFRFKTPYHWSGRVDYGYDTVLVEVDTDEGVSGLGECIAAFPGEGVQTYLRGITPMFVGDSPHDVERLMTRAACLGGMLHTPSFANTVLAGIEMALWDIIGKAAGVPVYQLLGGRVHSSVDYFGFIHGETTEELAADAQRLCAEGYTTIYLKVGRGAEADLRNVTAVRAAIGERRLRLDANGAWSVSECIHMFNQLLPHNIEWIEQPTPPMSVSAMRSVKESTSVPLAADQSVFTLHDVYDICRQRAADAIVLGIHETGGLLAWKKAAAVAEAAGVSVCLHGQFTSGITDAAQRHVAVSTLNMTAGNQIMWNLITDDIVASPNLTPVGGRLGVPEGPGLGVELDRDAVARAAELHQRNELNTYAAPPGAGL